MGYKTSASTILAMTFLVFGSPRTVPAQTPDCDDALARRAEVEADHLKTWEQIYDWFKHYSTCNEGAPAEGYSDAVVRMLADRWDQLPTFQTLVDRDKRFGKFVFQHIDATTDDHDLDLVVANADRHCPRGDGQLCGTIKLRALAARSQRDEILHRQKQH
jgi:hypothetical protein